MTAARDRRARSAVDDFVAANERYAVLFWKSGLPARPARSVAVVTCMDARLDPARFLGLEEGDALVIRNAGAVVTDDVLRSLLVSHWLLDTREAMLIAHTDCGLHGRTNEELGRLVAEGTGGARPSLDFLPFADLEASVRSGLRRIRGSGLFHESYRVTGFVYDVETARLRRVD